MIFLSLQKPRALSRDTFFRAFRSAVLSLLSSSSTALSLLLLVVSLEPSTVSSFVSSPPLATLLDTATISRENMFAVQPRAVFYACVQRAKYCTAKPSPRTFRTTLQLSLENSKANDCLRQARLVSSAAKAQSRQVARETDRQHNLRIKRLLHGTTNSTTAKTSYTIPNMYAVRVSVSQDLRTELRMNGREKRGRVFIEDGSIATRTLRGLVFELHAFFRALKKSSFLLSAGYPEIAPDGSILSPLLKEEGKEDEDTTDGESWSNFWNVDTDEDVVQTFARAQKFYHQFNDDNDTKLKGPSIVLHVKKNPKAPQPAPAPSYLIDMADPTLSTSMTMLSFYSFPPQGIADPEDFASRLRRIWKPFGSLGRVYVATEGVNAQMSVPTNVIENFMECCKHIPELGGYIENGINIDPIPLTMEEFAVAGNKDGEPVPPFKKLHIRVRSQIVADGLDKPLDWQNAGYNMSPLEWHAKLKSRDDDDATGSSLLILDCRNTYETVMGKFEGAEPLNTENFRDSRSILMDRLKDTPKDAPIMTYCTGGIRCVKVGAYLTQELGFTNVSRLAGGIIAYDRVVKEKAPTEESLFKGTNFVFDGRVGRQITNDALAECITCGDRTNFLSNCNNEACHKRISQCESCRSEYLGACSNACKQRVVNSFLTLHRKMPNPKGRTDDDVAPLLKKKYENLDDYSSGHSTPPPSLFKEIEMNTATLMATGSHMVSGAAQGRLLSNLASIAREGRVLELGTFSGYATACFLEGAANAGEAMGHSSPGDRNGGPFVMSLERDSRSVDLAVAHLRIMSDYGIGEEAAELACKLRTVGTSLEEIAQDTVSFVYKNAGCEVVRVNDALATLEEMAYGNGHLQKKTSPFDMVFVDADKTRLLDYVDACLNSNQVLKKGGLIVVDNVLWKGLVLTLESNESNSSQSSATISNQENGGVLTNNKREVKIGRRARKLANIMHNFNTAIALDNRAEVLVLPLRDGLSIIRKR